MTQTTKEQTEFLNRLWKSAMNDYSDYKRYKCQKGHSFRLAEKTHSPNLDIWKCIRCGKVLK